MWPIIQTVTAYLVANRVNILYNIPGIFMHFLYLPCPTYSSFFVPCTVRKRGRRVRRKVTNKELEETAIIYKRVSRLFILRVLANNLSYKY